jgi:SpoIVB peptidase S55
MTLPVAALIAEATLGAPSARAGGRVRRPDIMAVDDIQSGMKGYGLTVFEGTRPERFGVEVINVSKNYFPGQDLILVKVQHPRLDVVKSVAGMSGSPIFIDGKMVGAYAYGWPFGSEPVAGESRETGWLRLVIQ